MSAGTGGTILLEPLAGGYTINLSGRGHLTETITIRSQDLDNKATTAQIRGFTARNFVIEGIEVDNTDESVAGTEIIGIDIGSNSTNITIRDVTMRGYAAGYFNNVGDASPGAKFGGKMAEVRSSNNITFQRIDAQDYSWGPRFWDANDCNLLDSRIDNCGWDHVRLVGVQNMTVSGNQIIKNTHATTFDRNHGDLIQVWTPGATQRTSNLTIENNFLYSDDIHSAQAIFIGNEAFPGDANYEHETINVRNNTIWGGDNKGITVSGTNGTLVENNTVLHNRFATKRSNTGAGPTNSRPPIQFQSTRNGIARDNIAGSYSLGAENTDTGNITFESRDTAASDFDGANFVNVTNLGQVDLRDMKIMPGSAWIGKGSPASQPQGAVTVLTPIVRIRETSNGTWEFSAALSRDDGGLLSGQTGFTYLWTFADEATATDATHSRTFSTMGRQDVTLRITASDSSFAEITRSFSVVDPVLLALDFTDGIVDTSSYQTSLTGGAASLLVAGRSGDGLRIGVTDKVRIPKANTRFSGLSEFSIELDVKVDNLGQTGQLIDQTGGLVVTVNSTDGDHVRAGAFLDGAWVTVQSASDSLTTGWHTIKFTYDGSALRLFLDGVQVATTAATGRTTFTPPQDLFFGTFNGGIVNAVLDNITIKREA